MDIPLKADLDKYTREECFEMGVEVAGFRAKLERGLKFSFPALPGNIERLELMAYRNGRTVRKINDGAKIILHVSEVD